MKKILTVLLLLTLVLSLVACGEKFDPSAKSEGVMTYAEYAAAEMDADVVIEAYVQATQSWWSDGSDENVGKITVYLQDPDGAYFVYDMACSKADAAKLTKGTKIKVTGVKAEWSGEIEIMEGTWVAEALDVTNLLGTDELIKHQNEFVSFTDLTIEKIEYRNGEPGDDIYVTVSKDGNSYSFCVEMYLTGPDTEVYTTVGSLAAGDVVDVEGFLYWYQGANPHITSVTKVG